MSHPVVTLKCVENVGHVVELLKLTTYNGFPVVDPPLTDQVSSCDSNYYFSFLNDFKLSCHVFRLKSRLMVEFAG